MQVKVSVPATSANLGPGFDCLGLALGLYNEFTMSLRPEGFEIELAGEGADLIPTDKSNLTVQAATYLANRLKRPLPGLAIKQINHVPAASGLGSSSTAIIAGLLGVNELFGRPYDRSQILCLATEMEGHPDNVAPALFGGLVLVPMGEGGDALHIAHFPVHPMRILIVQPDFELLTSEARAALPSVVSRADAIFNLGRLPLLIKAFADGDYHLLGIAMQDRLHQPYRMPLIPGMAAAFATARQAGAAAVAISGAGPSIIAFAADSQDHIAAAMKESFTHVGLSSRSWILPVDKHGATVQRLVA